MAKVLIDLGSHDGSATRPMWPEYDVVYCWEPNPDLWHYYVDAPVHLVEAAAYTEDDRVVRLFRSNDGIMLGSSTWEDKTTGDVLSGFSLPVPSRRFARWLLDRCRHGSVTLKMNIEGGEYRVLPDMVLTGAVEVVDRLLIAWHHEKVPSISLEQHDAAVAVAAQIPIVEEWRP